jgi:amino acid transporter
MKKNKLFLAFTIFLFLSFSFALAADGVIPNPIGESDISGLINKILGVLISAASAVLGCIVVISGIRMIVSAGNPEEMKKAKNAIIYAIIGMVVLVSADAILETLKNIAK